MEDKRLKNIIKQDNVNTSVTSQEDGVDDGPEEAENSQNQSELLLMYTELKEAVNYLTTQMQRLHVELVN